MTAALRARVSPRRFEHIQGVVETAAALGDRYSLDREALFWGALLHDWFREEDGAVLLKMALEAGHPVCTVERMEPRLLHGPVAAAHFADRIPSEAAEAIRLHTTGGFPMGNVAKAVYLADAMEPSRRYPGVARLRRLAGIELERAFRGALEQTLRFLLRRQAVIHPASLIAWNNGLGRGGVGPG